MVRILACAMTIALISTQLQAADQEAGKSLYSSNCAQCHGPTAKGMASFPSLAGREASYIQSRLETYRAGERVGANSGLMIPNARDLSDEDIANLSAYISENFK
ncbi:c-type cytochrome [Marinobacter sp.]|uniref:c-type cytochrome n=1 Tax=Marinobacter sp. TaxID=50741 RepID=UPI000C3785B0|nr:c-type cytochrome [Marinobacter sp.]MBE95342.1 cytochrome C [Marinobacter sp.]|tara:strand:- start:230 stop:541 length:312 start_codon:yes stop_codon:yes gene_type:complete